MIKHIYISGRVQGVGFRYFTRKNAEALNLSGWVKNLPDGRVEAEIEGEEDQIEAMIERLKKGPRSSYVSDMEIEDLKNEKGSDGKYTGFEVVR